VDEAIRQTVADCYRQFGFRVHRRALAILGDEEDARDCTQQVFERLAERLRTFEGRSAIQTWIYVVATREALQIRRARSSRLTREDRWARDAAPSSHPAAADRAEARQLLAQLEDRLEPPLLEVAVLYFFDGLEQAEIGQLLGVSRRTVIRRLNTVRQEAGRLAAAGA
jgi:RNA polymerase sigma-70 factor (ECF subfamily)